jgi:hypothetical protein
MRGVCCRALAALQALCPVPTAERWSDARAQVQQVTFREALVEGPSSGGGRPCRPATPALQHTSPRTPAVRPHAAAARPRYES